MDLAIVACYMIVTIIVGFIAGRKVKTMSDFAVASKKFPTSVLVSTVFATWMGGDDLVGVSERIYSIGIIFFVVACAQTIDLFVEAYIIAPKIIKDFSDKISIGEIIGALYGKIGQVMCGIANMLFSIGYVAVQVSAIGYICNLLLGIPHFDGTLIGSLIIIMYSSFGGIRSVVFTDVLQFTILMIGIPLIANIALDKAGGWSCLLSNLPANHLNVGPSHESFKLCLMYFLFCTFPLSSPVMIQRILMAKGVQQATNSLAISGILYIPFYAIVAIIALCAVILFPGIDPNSAFLDVLDYSLPPIVKGIAISGVLAVIMSTADSFLNVSAIAAARDVFGVVWPNKLNDKTELGIARAVTIVFGLSSVYIATMFHSMIDFSLYFSNFWAPTVIAPMILYMFDLRTDKQTYLYSLCVGMISIITYRYSVPEEFTIISQLVGMAVTLTCMIFFGKCFSTISRVKIKHAYA
mgnify:CR=1 FL=1